MADTTRVSRLRRFLTTVANGNRSIKRREDAALLLEAICAHTEPVQCVSRILGQPALLAAVRQSLRIDLSDDFLNSCVAPFILYISTDDIRNVNGGQLLLELELALTDPPLLWDALRTATSQLKLSALGLESYSLLVLDLLALLSPTKEAYTQLNVPEAAQALCPSLVDSQAPSLRSIGFKIQEALRRLTSLHDGSALGLEHRPGGRHDNDFADFRKIAIFPTTDELISKEEPFYRTAESVLREPVGNRVSAHLDNQFRLLREDFMKQLREDLEITDRRSQQQKRRRPALRLRGLQLSGINAGASTRLRPPTIALRCWDAKFKDLPNDPDERRKHFKRDKSFLRHGSFGCLLHRDEVICFATVDRDEDLLARTPSVLLLQVFGVAAVRCALLKLKMVPAHEIEFVMVDTPFFAYEPVLNGLQHMPSLPLAEHLLELNEEKTAASSSLKLEELAERIRAREGLDLRHVLRLPKTIELDQAQTKSVAAGLTQAVSLIQGPPGTGKSFLGALLAKAFLNYTSETILVLCYTNHALDQFLEDIMDMGVAKDRMTRLGSKSTTRTHDLLLTEQTKDFRAHNNLWQLRQAALSKTEDTASDLEKQGSSFSRWRINDMDLLDSLEFSDSDSVFLQALTVPQSTDGMIMVGASGKEVDSGYLLDRWKQGKDAGVFCNTLQAEYPDVWDIESSQRAEKYFRWVREVIAERTETICSAVDDYGTQFDAWKRLRDARSGPLVQSKRIIGCTTTGAAKYSELLAASRPGIVLVEEAGEVLESHVLTALGSRAQQLILIGDHLQLRPKIANHGLTVEKGEGFNLNMSLFERLVVSGYPHTVLTKQHRMRPEISTLVRRLMYPDLQDSERTLDRENIRGLQSNVIFINHEKPEESNDSAPNPIDGHKKSRKNLHEVMMVLRIVRHLARQGYGTDSQVVLTPYLGQLRLLIDHLKTENDPVLNDLDSHDLVQAGLLDPASASVGKRPLRISTIDNYQGEESSIVIVSLTRSNPDGDIGFLSEAQRLNVLLSRARDGLIIIGNAATFRASKKGRKVWDPFFKQLSDSGQLYEGLPVRCEKHPQSSNVLSSPDDFDLYSPNGGCTRPCQALLSCKKHRCPEPCHQVVDHSKVKCQEVIHSKCPQNHQISRRCWEDPSYCRTCDIREKKRKAQEERDLRMTKKREALEKAYLEKLLDLDDEIAKQQRFIQDHREADDRKRDLEQKQKELDKAKALAENVAQKADPSKPHTDNQTPSSTSENGPTPQAMPSQPSEARVDWEKQKRVEGSQNEHIDKLMEMIGLDAVKRQVLNVKDKINTTLRQGSSLAGERFGTILLGNPGTGKTTVARLYAKCLASMGAVPGGEVEETTASKLTTGGLPAFQKLLEKILNAGGGTMFIDEAYQLASANTGISGKQILDALLDAAEIHRGKVIFFLAGYEEEMEDVMSHNPGLPSRFPHEFRFEDYSDKQLLAIFQQQLFKAYNGRMQLEGGSNGLYARIVARRVGYGRGRPGFGNARAMENSFAKIRSRQAARISRLRHEGVQYDDFVMSQQDLIGPEPSSALASCKAWTDLQQLIGLDEVKESVTALLMSLKYNYERELKEQPLLQFNLNKVFLGSPGTGKTTVAKLYGEILRHLGLLSNGQVVVRNPSDFVGDVLGASEKNTKGILAATLGKVLVIDEAYSLYSPGTGTQQWDPFKAAVVDTLVAEVQSVPGDDRCVLLLGYRAQMEAMFQNVNPGLSRRFPISEAFEFADFTDDQLQTVVELKLEQQGYTLSVKGMEVIMDCLKRARNKPNFGNAGEVDILLNTAKGRHMKRQARSKNARHSTALEPQDIDPEFDRGEGGKLSVRGLFQDTVGAGEVIARFEKIQKAANNYKRRGVDPRDHVPFNFRFVGPPGTGKTTTARKIGALYYDIGILATKEVLEVSATDLVGEYVGQTGPKTQKLLEKALGKVLFIDEAYRLAEGHFAKEAMDEIVDRVTKPEFFRRLIIVLAGYDNDIKRLMTINPGLSSRFPETVAFKSLPAENCWSLLIKRLQQKPFITCSQLETMDSTSQQSIIEKFKTLTHLDDWANARDIETLASTIANTKFETSDETSTDLMPVTPTDILQALEKVIAARKPSEHTSPATASRKDSAQPFPHHLPPPPTKDPPQLNTTSATPHRTEDAITMETEEDQQSESPPEDSPAQATPSAVTRDPSVPDAIWFALEQDKRRQAESEAAYATLVQAQLDLETALRENQEAEAAQRLNSNDTESDEDEDQDDEAARVRERQRIEREMARRKQEEMLEGIRNERAEKERERERERVNQTKLRRMGVCPMGFRWIRQTTGYRCAGGSHFVGLGELEGV